MKTLIISPYSPYPTVFGGAIRMYHLLKMFAQFSEVTLICYVGTYVDAAARRHLETLCKHVVAIDNSPTEAKAKWLRQARAMLGTRTFQYYSFYSRNFQRAIDQALQQQQFDYIVAEQSQMGYLRCHQPGALHILDQQNIEVELLRRRAAVQSNPLKKAALAWEAHKFAADEHAICRRFDLIFIPSERERDLLRQIPGMPRVEALPNSIDVEYFAHDSAPLTGNEIAFIGTTHVDANRDSLCYFMDQIFPLIEQRVPDIHFSIVGGNPPPVIRHYGARPNIEVTGFVPDVRPYMARARVLVVPLRLGGGTRLKILEGLSYGVPTVSTTIGAEGIDLVDGEHILLADTPQAFADKVVAALCDSSLQQRLRAAGRALVEERYSWQAVGRLLRRYLDEAPAHTIRASAPLAFLEDQP